MTKKLQVFVSSTFTDLREERQAVVEAILRAGHIPAGMELFAAGDKSQLEIIKRWIEDSDVFMLILGGRYGTIEPDSGKSYIQLEYEHAGRLGKPYFAAVMHDDYLDEKVKADGRDVLEQDRPDLLKQFKGQVTAKICRFFKNTDELKLTVLESLLDIERNRNLVGWVRADANVNVGPSIPSDLLSAPTSEASAEIRGTEYCHAVLTGMFLEIYLNDEVTDSVMFDLTNLSRGDGLIPLRRLNQKATAGFLQFPVVPLNDPMIQAAWVYLQDITILNRLVDSIDNPSAPSEFVMGRIREALPLKERIKASGANLSDLLSRMLQLPKQ